jgi:O-antigen ligase
MGKSLKSFFLGVDLDTQVLIQKYSGNLHNSFLFVHAYMGIFGFVAMLILILRAVVRAIRSGRGVYLCCILTLCFRGMTDHMFGGNRLSAIAIAILLVTEVIRDKNEDPKDLMVRGVMK